ncbi:MAG TPA: histidinol dehydrogenase, partial [Actinomycetospora sp.]|nr:histidinol dehydrogenase [Actinomycetospora sp.]
MLSRIDLRDDVPAPAALRAMLPRAAVDIDAVVERVTPVIDAVRERGVDAVMEYAEHFDRVRPASVRVPGPALREALDAVDPDVRAA